MEHVIINNHDSNRWFGKVVLNNSFGTHGQHCEDGQYHVVANGSCPLTWSST